MEFYHFLKLRKPNGVLVDIGGASEGGSPRHWLLAFEPNEYTNNLDKILEKKNTDYHDLKIGYETNVTEALERLRHYEKELEKLENIPMTYKGLQTVRNLKNGIDGLLSNLYRCKEEGILWLDQNETAIGVVIYDENYNAIGLCNGWNRNEAEENKSVLLEIEKEKTDVKSMIEDVAKHLPMEEISGFHDELIDVIAHSERGWGPTKASVIILYKKEEVYDNPSVVYKSVMYELMKQMEKQKKATHVPSLEEDPWYSPIKEADIVNAHYTMMMYIAETMEYLESSKRSEVEWN